MPMLPTRSPRAARRTRRAAPLLAAAALAVAAPAAHGHGGVTLGEGTKGGVTVVLQATDAATASGKPGADVSTVMTGPGTGERAKVVFWVRPQGGRTVQVRPERDEAGVHHATIATEGRGDWRDWDVSAVVSLAGGERLRVTNAPSDPPGPDPAARRPRAEASLGEPGAAATTPAAEEAGPAEQASTDVADISGEGDGAPAWALPSLAAIIALGLAALLWQRRRSDGHDD